MPRRGWGTGGGEEQGGHRKAGQQERSLNPDQFWDRYERAWFLTGLWLRSLLLRHAEVFGGLWGALLQTHPFVALRPRGWQIRAEWSLQLTAALRGSFLGPSEVCRTSVPF